MKKYFLTFVAIITTNLITLYGVLYHDWSISNLIVIYFIENIIIGLFCLKKLKLCSLAYDTNTSNKFATFKLGLMAYTPISKELLMRDFRAYYFGFLILFQAIPLFYILPYMSTIEKGPIAITILAFSITQIILYKSVFVEKREFEKISAQKLFTLPLSRAAIIMMVIFMGSFFVAYSAPILIILLKSFLDILYGIKDRQNILENDPYIVN